jgi:hypothetical protein
MEFVIRCRVTASFIHLQLSAAVADIVRHSTVPTGTRRRTLSHDRPRLKSRMSGLDYRAHAHTKLFPETGKNIKILLPE